MLREMNAPKPGMGRGLAAILAVSEGSSAAEGVRELAIASIVANPKQPRRRIDEHGLRALAASFGEQGVLQPVLVRPKGAGYELIAGERRWRAAALAGIEKIPALVRSVGDAETVELALIENMAREDLNPVEEARACAALAEELGLSREQIARRVGRSRVAISNLVRLLELPDEVLTLLETGALSEGHGRALLMAEDHDTRRKLARAAAREGWSVRVTERRARGADAPTRHAASGADRDAAGLVSAATGGHSELLEHPDRVVAAQSIADSLEAVLGAAVHVRYAPAAGYIAELSFASQEEALSLARRLRPRSVA
jgi:ParB family transcriptional regulator, chromosome partitioning protein